VSDGSSASGGAGAIDPSDTRAPRVVAITPEDGAVGVDKDAVITITFDEPMDQASAQAAVQSPQLAGGVTFSWDDTKTVLTVTPTTPLPYATGNDGVVANSFEVKVTTTAEDRAGNTLEKEATTQFSTLRLIGRSVPLIDAYNIFGEGSISNETTSSDCEPAIGDTTTNIGGRAFLRFDLSMLPDDIVGISSAALALRFYSFGNPFGKLGVLTVEHYTVATYTAQSLLATADELATVAPLAANANGDRTVDVTSAIAADFADRAALGGRTGFRFSFPILTNSDGVRDRAQIDCDSQSPPALVVQYTRP